MRLCACLPKPLPCSFRLSWLNLSKVKREPAPQNRNHAPATRLTGVLSVESSGGLRRVLSDHLLHKSAHGSDVAGRTAFYPGLIALRRFFHVGKIPLVRPPFPSLRDDSLRELPSSEKLSARLEEEIFVKQTIVEQCAGLLPITEHHCHEGAPFRAGGRDAHGVIKSAHMVVLEEPVPSLAQTSLATHFIDLQVELSLFVGRCFCRFHCYFSFSSVLLVMN